eukprot:CAMPEP_0173292964 /NCGR_PEP_ID=MMETSP1143-20121109/13026_1 /TAXON_ID=483371 /ORGANISM="non described non described, Strain CCMP2298" /LENGTH=151 /DNA_ID=CAMNT_0014232421 /DNA_START=211 /DNA_END=663 /DNA_ORIENTATION=-
MSNNKNNKYQRLEGQEEGDRATEMTSLTGPGPASAPTPSPSKEVSPMHADSYKVKVLYREKAHEVAGLGSSSTVGELKRLAETALGVPPPLQRLIFAGKQLKPDEKLLSDFKLGPNASVHLFPLPVPAATPVGVGAGYPVSVQATALPEGF